MKRKHIVVESHKSQIIFRQDGKQEVLWQCVWSRDTSVYSEVKGQYNAIKNMESKTVLKPENLSQEQMWILNYPKLLKWIRTAGQTSRILKIKPGAMKVIQAEPTASDCVQ